MFRRRAFALFVMMFCALAVCWWFSSPAGAAPDDPRAAILGVLNRQAADWNRGDIPAFLQGYWNSPDVTFSGSSGITRGWESVRARYEKNYADRMAMGTLDFSEIEVRSLAPNAALVLGKWHLQRQSGDVGGVFTLVFQKFPEGWKVVHDHTSVVAPAKN